MELFLRRYHILLIYFYVLEEKEKTLSSHTRRCMNESLARRCNALPPSPSPHYVKRYSVGLSARSAWTSRLTSCEVLLVAGYLNSLGKWSLYGHSKRQKVRKYESYKKKEKRKMAGHYPKEKLPRYCQNVLWKGYS